MPASHRWRSERRRTRPMIAPAFTQRITPWRERMWNWKGGLGGENSLRALRSDAVEKRALRLVTDLSARGRCALRIVDRSTRAAPHAATRFSAVADHGAD